MLPGIKIAGGRSALGADFGIFVKKVLSGGVADLDGKHNIKFEMSVIDLNYIQSRIDINRGYYMAAQRYKISLRAHS